MEEQQPETLNVHLSRHDSGMSWGFRLQGGVDFNTPLSVQVVQPKSVAERCGLRAGDGILRINNTNTDGLTHEQAKMEIIRSCNDIDMLIVRGAVQIWRPKVTPMSELRPETKQPVQTATGDQIVTVQKTSLARDHTDESAHIGSSYNRSARPFPGAGGAPQRAPQQPQYQPQQPQYQPQQPQYQPQQPQYQPQPQQPQYQPHPTYQQPSPPQPQYGGGQPYGNVPTSPKQAVPNVVHAQFNSPIGLYSAGNIADSYAQQTAGIQKEMENLDIKDAPVGARMTGTYQRLDSSDQSQPSGFRSVSAPVAKPPGPSSGPKQESMHCTGCGNLVTGVFVRIKGMPYHEKCFQCAKCGVFLKQKGYFMIEGQLYCETHAKQVAEAPGGNMRVAGAVYR